MLIGGIDWKILYRGSSGNTALWGFFIRLVMLDRLSNPAADARSHATLAIGYSRLSSRMLGSVGGLVRSAIAAARTMPMSSGVQSPPFLLLIAPRLTRHCWSDA